MLKRAQCGVTLIELIVVLAILAVTMTMAAQGFASWIQNLRLRSSAESILSGLQFAKSEAIARNSLVRFQFTSTMDSSCTLSSTSPFWVVNIDPTAPNSVEGNCGVAPSEAPAASPFVLRKHDGSPGPNGLVVNSSGVTNITFNGVGRPVGGNTVQVDLTNPTAGNCSSAAATGGPVTCLRVVVSASGQVRMCNPRYSLPDPQGC